MRAQQHRQSFAAALVGSFAEAWAEVRIHKTRVLLSLIGVAVAVAAITMVAGLGGIAQQALTEGNERSGGRPATLNISAYSETGDSFDTASFDTAVDAVVDRYRIRYHTRMLNGSIDVQLTTGVQHIEVTAVDVDYRLMHRVVLSEGSWFSANDSTRLAPAIVVNDVFWQSLGSPDLRSHPSVRLLGEQPVTGVIIGVLSLHKGDSPSMMMLTDAYRTIAEPGTQNGGQSQYEAWVPPALSKKLASQITRELGAAIPAGANLNVSRQDYAAFGGDPLLPFKIVVGGVAGLVLFLGALSLVNISLVTVRQRIREIGIRRSFGATAGRVFFAVMMESVVASLAAGAVGVIFAVFVVENPWVQGKISQGVSELPAFPIEAALLGLGSATLVGALAGLLPAVAAVRFTVIDAIRY